MNTVAAIFRRHGADYLDRYGEAMPPEHRRVLEAVRRCRTPAAGLNLYTCPDCGAKRMIYLGCGDRHCPNCQKHAADRWLEARLDEFPPGPAFLVTFTVPQQLRAFMRANQRLAYNALFRAASDALKALAAEPKYVGGDLPGFFGVLHTWGATLSYHPHIHFLVAGGALVRDTRLWQPARARFFVPVHALSKCVRGRFETLMHEAGVHEAIPPEVWSKGWNVNSQAIGSNVRNCLRYLARYVFRVAICDARIEHADEHSVTFRYRRRDNGKHCRMTLAPHEFIRRFLQHVVPSGFMRVRYYGFLASACPVPRQEVNLLIELDADFRLPENRPREPEPSATGSGVCCPACKTPMRLAWTLTRSGKLLAGTGARDPTATAASG